MANKNRKLGHFFAYGGVEDQDIVPEMIGEDILNSTEDNTIGGSTTGSGGFSASALKPLIGAMPNLNTGRSGNTAEIDAAIYGDMGSDPLARAIADITGHKTRMAADSIRDNTVNFQGIHNNDNLENAFGQIRLYEKADPSFKAHDILDNLDASGQGAIHGGSVGGPWGALVGGIVGGVANLASQLSRGARAKKLNKEGMKSNESTLSSFYSQGVGNAIDDSFSFRKSKIMAEGGTIENPNGFDNGVTKFNVGGSHESNPLGGIPQGIASDGQTNLVEEGEVRYQDYIFSDKLSATKQLLEENLLPEKYAGKSFAWIADKLQKGSEERPNDNIELQALDENMKRLADAQEQLKAERAKEEMKKTIDNMSSEEIAAMQQQQMQQHQQAMPMGMEAPQGLQPGMFRKGGDVFAGGTKGFGGDNRLGIRKSNFIFYNPMMGYLNTDIDFVPQNTLYPNRTAEYRKDFSDFGENILPSATSTPVEEKRGFFRTLGDNAMRKAPLYASGLQTFLDTAGITNSKNYSTGDQYRRIAGMYDDNLHAPYYVSFRNYDPIDVNLPVAVAESNAAAHRRALANTSNGNRATLAALLNEYNMREQAQAEAVLEAARDANLKRREAVDNYNLGVLRQNAEMASNYDQLNLQQRNARLQALIDAANMDDEMLSSRLAVLQANRDRFANNLGLYGNQLLNEEQVLALIDAGLFGPGIEQFAKRILGWSDEQWNNRVTNSKSKKQ